MSEMEMDCSPDQWLLVFCHIYSYMRYPKDADKRKILYKGYLMKVCAEVGADIEIPMSFFYEAILSQDKFDFTISNGFSAGATFLHLLELKASQIKPSVNKAVAITYETYLPNAKNKEGEGLTETKSYSRAMQHWGDFKQVSHFWAAFLLIAHGVIPKESIIESPFILFSLMESLTIEAKALNLNIDFFEIPPNSGFKKIQYKNTGLSPKNAEIINNYKSKDYRA